MSKQYKDAEEASDIEEMFQAGLHYGYSRSRRHPSVSQYIFGTKNRTDIIDLEKTRVMLGSALDYLNKLAAGGKTILFVGTKAEAKVQAESAAKTLNMPWVTERWIGGTLSNFTEIKKRISELENYQKESSTGALEKYTKKERGVMAKKMEKLSKYYSGLLGLKKLPDALVVIDAEAERIAVTEANKTNVPAIALANSD